VPVIISENRELHRTYVHNACSCVIHLQIQVHTETVPSVCITNMAYDACTNGKISQVLSNRICAWDVVRRWKRLIERQRLCLRIDDEKGGSYYQDYQRYYHEFLYCVLSFASNGPRFIPWNQLRYPIKNLESFEKCVSDLGKGQFFILLAISTAQRD